MDNIKKNFEKTYDNIKAPENLKEEMLHKMFEEEARLQNDTNITTLEYASDVKKSHKRSVYRYVAPMAAVFAAVLCIAVFWPKGAVYVTPMEDAIYYEKVELKNGIIKFNQNRVAISITPNAGNVVIGEESVMQDEDVAEHILVQEKTKGGGELIYKETMQLSLPEIREDAWSNIGKQKIYVTVLKTDEYRYQAAFEKEGAAYEVVGNNVSQKEFIDFLYAQIK